MHCIDGEGVSRAEVSVVKRQGAGMRQVEVGGGRGRVVCVRVGGFVGGEDGQIVG